VILLLLMIISVGVAIVSVTGKQTASPHCDLKGPEKYKPNQTVNDGVAHSKNPRKCAYHVTFDLDLENTLYAGLPGDHRVQVWSRSGHLPARRSDLRKSLQTDRRTDDGRLAIV